MELFQTPLVCPMKTTSHRGARYHVSFVDDYSPYIIISIQRQESQTLAKFGEYKAPVENYHNHKIKDLRSDIDVEYTSNQFSKFKSKSGIPHPKTKQYWMKWC